jgi:RNA polymerase sigma-70 factor (ECF subfamily)
VRAGDVSAAAAFHDRLRPVVDRTLCRLIGSRDGDYEDLSQHALIDLTLSVDRFRGECPLEAWAAIVVARVAYRHIRRRKLERRLFSIEPAELVEWPDRSLPARVVHRGTLRQVQQHLAAMEVKKAWTFLLHDVWGYDLEEVAAITGVSSAAAQSRLVRGRRWLHERIARDPDLSARLDESERGLP